MVNLITCGIINDSNESTLLACNPDNGELVMLSDYSGNVLISDVLLDEPMYVPNTDERIEKFLSYYKAIGVAFGENTFVIFKTNTAYTYSYKDTKNAIRSCSYDLNTDFSDDFNLV